MIPIILIGAAYLIGKTMQGESYAKGGKITTNDADFAKFKKVGIDDKYTIEAIKDVGLGKFDKESILSDIEAKYKALLSSYKNYVLSEDSEALTNAIKHDIEVRINGGDSLANIKEAESWLTDKDKRKQYMQQIIDAQTATITEWVSYLKQSDYSIPFKYLILKAVLGYYYDYKLNKLIEKTPITTRNFTPFDAGSLAELYASNSNYLLQDYTQIQVGNALKILESKDKIKETSGGVWIKFNGGSKTSEKEIAENARQLSQMVQNTFWCTKTNAYAQLKGGDFYVFVTKKDEEVFPRIAVRMEEDRVGELRGNNSASQDLEEDMLPIAKDFLLNNIPNDSGKKWLDSIDYNDKVIAFKDKLTDIPLTEPMYMEFLNLKCYEKKYLLDYADRNGNMERLEILIKEKINKNDFKGLVKSDFAESLTEYTIKTKHIIGGADFSGSLIENLGNLITIGGDADFEGSQVKNLGNLTIIGGNTAFFYSKFQNLGKLTTIGGYAYFRKSKIRNLSNLTTIIGDADFHESQVENLGNLTTIYGYAYFQNSQVKDLGNLYSIGQDAHFYNNQVENLGNLTTIGGYANFSDSIVKNLGNLTTIGGDANFQNSQVKNLGKLTTIGGDAYFSNSKIKNLGKLTTIDGMASFQYSQVQSLGSLESIGGDAYFQNSKIKNLGKLTTIVGNAWFEDSEVQNLGKLTTIGGDANFEYSQFENLGNLTTIGKDAMFENSKFKDLGKLVSIGRDVFFTKSQVENLGDLITIGRVADFKNSKVKNLGKLTAIGGNAFFRESKVKNLGSLTTIDGWCDFDYSQVENLGNLTTIGYNAYFENSKIKSLGNLTTIGGDAMFEDSIVEDLGKLNKIDGIANFKGKPELKKEWVKRQKVLKNKV